MIANNVKWNKYYSPYIGTKESKENEVEKKATQKYGTTTNECPVINSYNLISNSYRPHINTYIYVEFHPSDTLSIRTYEYCIRLFHRTEKLVAIFSLITIIYFSRCSISIGLSVRFFSFSFHCHYRRCIYLYICLTGIVFKHIIFVRFTRNTLT